MRRGRGRWVVDGSATNDGVGVIVDGLLRMQRQARLVR